MSTQTQTDPTTTLNAQDIAAIEAIMAEAGVDRDIAANAIAEARSEFVAEPETAGVPEDEQYLRCYTRRRFLIEAEETRVADQMKAMLRNLAAKKAGLDFLARTQAEHLTHKMLAAKGGKAKSIKLPHGTVGFRATPGSLDIPTEKAPQVIEWCEKNLPDAVKVRKEVLKTPIADLFKLSGELPPGVQWNAPRDKFYVS